MELLCLVGAVKDGGASVQLDENTAQRPHVDLSAVRQTEHDFRGAVETRLNVFEELHDQSDM